MVREALRAARCRGRGDRLRHLGDRFTFPFVGIHTLPAWVGIPLTIIWIVAIMNMFNFLDGLDGLAAGVAAIAGLTFCVIALSLGKFDAAVLSAIVFGACVGFLRHNFYPARIFMGDSGALLLGYVLATIAVQGLLKTAATVALFFPLLVLAVPIVDTTFVVVRRLKHGEHVFEADQAHLHHRFLRRGFSQRRAALTSGPGAFRSPRPRSRPASSPSAPTASGIPGGRCSPRRSVSPPSSSRSTWSTCSRS